MEHFVTFTVWDIDGQPATFEDCRATVDDDTGCLLIITQSREYQWWNRRSWRRAAGTPVFSKGRSQ